MVDRVDKAAKRPVRTNIYSDIFTNFNAHPNTGVLLVRSDVDAVKRALRNLLMTNKGERVFDSNLGSNIKSLLFEPSTEINRRQLQTLIREAIETYEKRAILQDVVVSLSNDEETYIIDVYFRIINSPDVNNLNVKLDRIR
jgi:phage baseplate assembly protein W